MLVNKIEGSRNQLWTQNYLKLPPRKEFNFFFLLLEPPDPYFFLSSREFLALLASWLSVLVENKGNLHRRACCFRTIIIRNILYCDILNFSFHTIFILSQRTRVRFNICVHANFWINIFL